VPQTFLVSEVAEILRLSENRIITLIRTGQLEAVDVSMRRAERPRWRVTQQALDNFQAARSSLPAKSAAPRQHREKVPEYV